MNDELWNKHPLANKILVGILGEEKEGRPGIYAFSSTCGHSPPDVQVLSQDAALDDSGSISKPKPGSACVVAMGNDGAPAYVIGFIRVPVFDEGSEDDPVVGNPEENKTSGDKVFKTSGGASLILKRGGAVIIEGGAGTGIIMNPLNNQMSLRSTNYGLVADGYRTIRGRLEPGSTQPETLHTEDFLTQVGPDFDRFTIAHGTLPSDGRRQLSLSSVTIVSGQESVTVRTRETYSSDGSWVGEGPKYQWGGDGADEPAVLGKELVTALEGLIDIVKELKVNTAWGPSTPPLPPTLIALDQLKSKLSGNILSNFLFFKKDPPSLG